MALEIVAGTPGLWRDPEWKPGTLGAPATPGVYALIIGASAYPHLSGGDKQVPDTFGMGQLFSSASTAAALFEWLRWDFRCKELPLVWCQLLLSPNAEEKARLDAEGLRHYGPADNDGMRKAIQHWTGNVPAQAPAAQRSRTLFFFSGHGVLSNWRSLLLPSDYLDPCFGAPQLENCISTRELKEWMWQSPVLEHLALIDACQNEFSPLASKGATANSCFPIQLPGGSVPRTAAALASTSPNAVAYQAATRPYTFFGEAVLEALRGIAGGNDARVEFRELADYVKPRVNVLLKEAGGATLEQAARLSCEGDDSMLITELAPPIVHAVTANGPPSSPTLSGLEAVRRASTAMVAGQRRFAPATATVLEASDARFDPAHTVREPIALTTLLRNFDEIRRRFGHEYASHPWRDGMALYALNDGRRIESDGSMVGVVQRNDASSLVQVDLALAPRSGGVLLVFEGIGYVQRERLAVALPTDTKGSVPIRLSLAFGPKLIKLEARLGPSSNNPHYQYLWELTREADLGSLSQVAARANPDRLKQAARDSSRDQTAATAGILLLARASRIGDVMDWTRNLMQWFPDIADGAVLWAESLRVALDCGEPKPFGIEDPLSEMARALETLEQRGMPFFADNLELTESLLRYVLRRLPVAARGEVLLEVQRRLERLFDVAMPSGHFIAMAGLPRPAWLGDGGALSVTELLGLLGRGST